ncbi:hypothetical protein [Paraburkholderia adhaesiva]|uniref:hypothetical protein n=1 Tax=Paraburkholderia adhaesiva TaxID=2883244 RepID=UPI001F19FEFF|nr:hypothetical protein [Paraburkholderia adhaesiva]
MYPTLSPTAPHPLPVRPDALEQNFLRFSIQDPPYVPKVEIESWMYSYVPIVAGMTANVIQEQSRKNPLRVFFFNLFARNRFVNAEFTALVQGILDFIVFKVAGDPRLNVEAIIDEAVEYMVSLVTGSMINVYPQLRNTVDAQTAQAADEHVRDFGQITQAIDEFRRRFGYQHPLPGQSGIRAPGYPGMMGMHSRMDGAGYPDIYPAMDHQRIAPGFAGRYDGVHEASAQLFGGTQASQPIVPRSGEIFSGRFANLPDTSVPRYARVNGATSQGNSTMNAVIEEKPAQKDGLLEDIDETALKWLSFRDQPYHPIFNPDTSQLFYQELASGDVLAVVKARGDDMDYDRHRTKSVFGPVPAGLDLDDGERVTHGLQQGLKEIREERQAREENETPEVCTRVKEAAIEESSLEAVWQQAAVEWQASAEAGRLPGIYRVYGDVYDTVVGDEDESDFVEELRNAGTFKNLRSILDDQYGVASDRLWYKANNRATRLVNRILGLNLGLPTTIDSFTEDFEPLLQMLRREYGEAMVEAFLRHQRTLIAAIYRETPEDNRVYVADSMCDTWPEGWDRPKLTFMSSWSSLTFVNCTAHELAVEWGKDTTALVTRRAVPVFYQIVRDIVEEAKDLGHNLEQYLLQTLDGKIIEIGTAFLADDEGYVVRLIK